MADDTIDISIEDDGAEKVILGVDKLKSFILAILSNDSADLETKSLGTVINEPTYGFKIERLMFSVGGKILTADYIKMRLKNAINMSPNSEITVVSDSDITIEKTDTGKLTVSVRVGNNIIPLN